MYVCVCLLKIVKLCVSGNWLTYTFGESGVAVVSAPVQDKIDKLKGLVSEFCFPEVLISETSPTVFMVM